MYDSDDVDGAMHDEMLAAGCGCLIAAVIGALVALFVWVLT